MDIKVKIVTKDNVDVYDSIKNLLLQLYNGMPEIINVDFNSVLDSSCTEVFIAQYEDKVIATATLVKYKKLVGYVGLIEDFIVDEECRGEGVGGTLLEHISSYGNNLGMDFIDVNTRRKDAVSFYKKHGFIEKGLHRKFYSLRYFCGSKKIL
jgi:N-acetylglutamate synthase-like GNAT family acetyltransferase